MNDLPPLQARVRLNATAHARLSKSYKGNRAREEGVAGTVVGYSEGKAGRRANVIWDKPAGRPPEPVHPRYLEES